MTELEALVTLNQLPKIGPITIRYLLSYFGSARSALSASLEEIQQVSKCAGAVGERIYHWKTLTDTPREMEECEKHGISLIHQGDPSYPTSLKDLKDAPVLLYVWGTLEEHDQDGIAVVGSRKTTNYGRTVTEQFSRSLALSGKTIISGLALGIDTIAHQTALSVGRRTIAVLGSGLGSLYPKENQELALAISENGAVVSEYPLFTNPDRQTFPQRNRIVAAWSAGTLVTEMPARSGAMITANYARDLRRPIFSIPGPIDRPSSEGCHLLIQNGAHLVTSPEHIIQSMLPDPHTQLDFNLDQPVVSRRPVQLDLSTSEERVLKELTSIEQTVEDLHQSTALPIPELSSALFSLEMSNLATQHVGMTYTAA